MLPVVRSRALRQFQLGISIRTHLLPSTRSQSLRSYADGASNTRPTSADPPRPPLKNNVPLILVGSVFLTLPFYYIFHSNKSANSEKQAIAEARKNGAGPANEYRDPRDSPVKTLEDKRRKMEKEG